MFSIATANSNKIRISVHYQIMPSSLGLVCYNQPGPPPPAASCYICLEDGTDSEGQPLLRNCACRGEAGWAHVACLANFADNKTMEAQRKQDHSIDISSFWIKCILCKTSHMQNMALAMADAFVKKYEHSDIIGLRFASLNSLARSRYDNEDFDGAFALLVRLQEMCDFLTSKGSDVRRQEGNLLSMIGEVFIVKEKFNDALSTFERQRELYVAVFGPNSPEVQKNTRRTAVVKEHIGIGERRHHREDTAAELVRARERFRENQECVDIRRRLSIHMRLVLALRNDGRYHEAVKQMKELVFESRQNLGPSHPDTLMIRNKAVDLLLESKQNLTNDATKYQQASEKKDMIVTMRELFAITCQHYLRKEDEN